MERQLRNWFAGVALCGAAMAVAPQSAHAYDVNGIGFGADAALGGPTGAAISIGLGRLELDFIVGMSLMLPEGGVLEPDFAAAGGVFFTLADGPQTNFQLGGRIGTIIDSQTVAGFGGTELSSDAAITFDLLARVEHRFDEHFAINLQAGIGMQIWPDDSAAGNAQPDLVFGFGQSGFVGGAGFRYWFDGLGGGEIAAPAPAPAPARAEPAAAEPAPTTAPATTEEGGSTPYWEQ